MEKILTEEKKKKWTNKWKNKQEQASSLSHEVTIQCVIPNICIKFQDPRCSSSREMSDEKKTRAYRQTNTWKKQPMFKPGISGVPTLQKVGDIRKNLGTVQSMIKIL